MQSPAVAIKVKTGVTNCPTNNPIPPNSCNPPTNRLMFGSPYRSNSNFILGKRKQLAPNNKNDTNRNKAKMNE